MRRRPSIDALAERLNTHPRDPEALRALVEEIEVAADRWAARYRDFGRQERDDVFGEVVKAYWTLVSSGRLPTEGLIGPIHVAVGRRFADRWRRAKGHAVPSSGAEDGSSPIEAVEGGPGTLTEDPLEGLERAYQAALARRSARGREGFERAWRRYQRVLFEHATLSDILREEEGEAGVLAGVRAHSRLIEAILAEAADGERGLIACMLYLRAVSDSGGDQRPPDDEGES